MSTKRTWAVFLRGTMACHERGCPLKAKDIQTPRPPDFNEKWYTWRGTVDGRHGHWSTPSIRDIVDMGLIAAADSAYAFYALSLSLVNHSTRRVRLRQYAAGMHSKSRRDAAVHALQALEVLFGRGPEHEDDARLYTTTLTVSGTVEPETLKMLLEDGLDCTVEMHLARRTHDQTDA